MIDNSFSQLLESAKSVLILLPTKPYFDQVAAGMSLYLSLRENKDVTISCPSPLTVSFNRIVGINKVTTELGNKNLSITFKNYDANDIEKVSYDIENGEFKLSVVPKTGLQAPQKEQIDLNYSGVAADLVILIGGANDSHFPILESDELQGVKIAHIGTRALASSKEVMSFAKPSSTTSELITAIIKENALPMDADVATNLVMGIEDGSGEFGSPDVTPETFETFAYLLRNGGQRPPKRVNPANFPAGSIPTQPLTAKIQKAQEVVQEMQGLDVNGTQETEADINPPEDWLQQPKIIKGAGGAAPQPQQPEAFGENKG